MKKNGTLHSLLNNWNFLALLWLIFNLLQARYTHLYEDEAYYWVFSQRLDWGYFDHPPMVALFIKLGYSLFQDELGVRLIASISLIATLRIIWEFIESPNKKDFVWLFFLLAFSLPFFQMYGFIITPDVPLLFFGSLTLLAYRFFIKKSDWKSVLFFGLASAGLMYSKYHGGLFILLIILSNWRLLKNPKFYAVGIIALLFFFPHLYWQYENDFPSFAYHISGRVVHQKWWYIPEYLLNQVLVYNPLLLLVFLSFLPRWKVLQSISILEKLKNFINQHSSFSKTLYFILYGFLGFFFLVSFQMRHIEPQWTLLAIIPLLILSFKKIISLPKLLLRTKWIGIVSFAIFLVVRLQLIFLFIPQLTMSRYTPQMVKEVEALTDSKPVIFLNSFQIPSLHAFYSNNTFTWGATSTRNHRDNQFSYWNMPDSLNHQEVYTVELGKSFLKADTAYFSNGKPIYYRLDNDYQNISQLKITPISSIPTSVHEGDSINLTLSVDNPYNYDIKFSYVGLYLTLGENRYRKHDIIVEKTQPEDWLKANSKQVFSARFVIPPKTKGEWKLNWSLQRKLFPMSYHGDFIPITIE